VIRIIVAALAITVLLSTPAMADPITLVAAAVNAVVGAIGLGTTIATIGTFTLTIGQVVGAALVAGASYLLESGSMNGSSSSSSIDPSSARSTFSTEESTELRVIGRARIGGLKAFGNTTGANRYRLVLHCSGVIDGTEQYYLGGREVVVYPDGRVASPPWAYSGGSYCIIKEDLGDPDKLSWPDLQSAFPDLWTADHRARGISQSLIKYVSPGLSTQKYLALYSGGAPDLEKIVRGEPVYDPRTDSVYWTDNGILCALHIALSYPEFEISDFDLDRISIEADKADELVQTATAYEPRSRCWGIWPSEGRRGDILQQVLDSIGAEFIAVGEKLAIALIDDVRTSELYIPADFIVEASVQSGPEAVDRPNICIVKYYSSERNFAMSEIDMTGVSWARVQNEIDSHGPRQMTVELPFCPSAAQAQRVARRKFALTRTDRWSIKTNMAGMAAWNTRVITIGMPDLGVDINLAISPPKIDDSSSTVQLTALTWPTLTPWDVNSDEALPPTTIPDVAMDSTMSTPSAPLSCLVVQLPDGTVEGRIAYSLSSGTAEAVIRSKRDRAVSKWVPMTLQSSGSYKWARVKGSFDGVSQVEAKIRAYVGDNNSNWSLSSQAARNVKPTPLSTANIAIGQGYFTITLPSDIAVTGVRAWIYRSGVSTVVDYPGIPGDVILIPRSGTGSLNIATLGSKNGPTSDWLYQPF